MIRTAKRQFWLMIFFASAVSRLLFMAGKMYFSAKQGTEYIFRRANTLPGIIIMGILVVSNLLTNLIAKVPVMHKYFLSESQTDSTDDDVVLGWRGYAVETSLKTAAMGYGLIQVGAAYFSISLIVKTTAELLGTSVEKLSLQEEIPLQIALALAAILASDTYLGYDYPISKKNARALASVLDANDFSADKSALFKTLLCSSVNLATYPALAYFFAKPMLTAIPGSDTLPGKIAVNVGIGISCLITFLTVLSWLPSAYQHFAKNAGSDSKSDTQHASLDCRKLLARSVGYPACTIDSIGEGLALFIAVVTTWTDLTNINKYGWIIGPAALAGVNGLFINLFFATLPGVKKFEDILDKSHEMARRQYEGGDIERAPLLANHSTLFRPAKTEVLPATTPEARTTEEISSADDPPIAEVGNQHRISLK